MSENQLDNNMHNAYQFIRGQIMDAQRQVYRAVNVAMVAAYWHIGKAIFEHCGENERAAYGKQVLKYLSERLTAEFGNGFGVRNLRNMRQFYLAFPKRHTVCAELSWSHYRSLIRVDNEQERLFYAEEAVKSQWSVRQLERQINTMYYHRLLSSQDKKSVAAEIQSTEPKPEYEQLVKDISINRYIIVLIAIVLLTKINFKYCVINYILLEAIGTGEEE